MSLAVDRQPLDAANLPDSVRKPLSPQAPPQLQMMAARGMLPLAPEENVQTLYMLSTQWDGEVSETARLSFDDLPAEILVPALAKLDHPGLLDWVAEEKRGDKAVLEAVVTNRGTHDHTIARIARIAEANLCDVIATNQVRILQAPVILEQMYQNANARMATVDRLLELAQREGVKLSGLPGVQGLIDSSQKIVDEDGGEHDSLMAAEAARAKAEDEKYKNVDEMPRSERDKLLNDDDEEEEEGRKTGALHDKIARMHISQKIRLATIGSREALNILVRDPNKLVHMAAVRSPRAQDIDYRRWARNKTLPDGVISYIASQRELTRHYEVMLALCQNPKTPLSDTMKFLNHIRNNDLKQLQRDRNVSMQVQRQAKNLYQKRSGR